ncbi:MAG: polyprenyl synthetase family protein [Mariniblastus sp.]
MSHATSHGLPSKNVGDAKVANVANAGLPNGDDASHTAAVQRSSDLKAVYAPIESELQSVEAILKSELQSKTPFVDELLQHSWLMGGKRIRPVFLLLSAASCGTITPAHLQMAAALEMVHTATLVHDDVLDEAETRRHRATANSTWGTKVSVLLGDYLFTHSFHVASLSGSVEALRLLARASNRVCEGEMRQNAWQGDFALTEENYMQMITEKTAELCGVGCRIGAMLSESTIEHDYELYGRNLGVAFQIVDDILDIVGHPEEVGKTLGTDLLNQKPTLPVIHCLAKCEAADSAELRKVLVGQASTTKELLPFLVKTGSIDYARTVAQQHARAATKFAQSLDSNIYSDALTKLATFVLDRTH